MYRTIKVYKVLYRSRSGNEILITTITRPERSKLIRGKKYKAVKATTQIKECIIVAKSTKKGKNDKSLEVTDDELEELESLETESDDDEDEVEEANVVEEDDEDDEDEKPAKGKKSKKDKDKPKRSRTTEGRIGTAELAENLGVPARTLRMVLRKHKIEKDDETGRYEWASMKDPTVKKIAKLIESGEHKQVVKDSLDKLKEGKAKEQKKNKKGKKNKKKSDDE